MLRGKTILITGGGSGIGEALAAQLAANNSIIICGRNEDKLKKVAAAHKNVSYYVADIAVPSEIDNLFKSIANDKIKLDVLFNNAGVVEQFEVLKTLLSSAQIFEKVNTNLSGSIAVTQQFIRQADTSAENIIANVTTAAAVIPFPILGLYSSSKAGLSVFTKILRQQLKGTKFKVVEIIPSQVNTEMPKQLGISAKGITTGDFAGKVINAINKGKKEYAPGFNVAMLRFINRFLPGAGLNLIDKISRKLMHAQ